MLHAPVVLTAILAQSPPSVGVAIVAPTLQVGVFAYDSDGSVNASAYSTDLTRTSRVYMDESGCRVGAGPPKVLQDASDAWDFSGTIVSMRADEVVIQLHWQRVLDHRQPSTTPESSVQLTLRPGDRVLLDSVLPRTRRACWSSAGFEARYGSPPFPNAGVRTHGDVTAVGGARHPDSAVTPAFYQADVWFIRSVPGRPDDSRHIVIKMHAGEDGAQIKWAPFRVDTASGPAEVAMTGTLSVVHAPDGSPQLRVAVRRTVTPGIGASFPAGYSTSGTVQPLPGAGDVVSFEMPPMKIDGADLPDRLSLRVRITPAGQPH